MATTTINLGLSLDGLSNVDSTGKANGDILRWNSVSGKWEDNALPTTAPAGTDGQIQFNSGGAFGADSGLAWNNSTKSLTVGSSFRLNGNNGTGFGSLFSIFRGATEVFWVDEYASKFSGRVSANSIIGSDLNAIIFGNQRGTGNVVTM